MLRYALRAGSRLIFFITKLSLKHYFIMRIRHLKNEQGPRYIYLGPCCYLYSKTSDSSISPNAHPHFFHTYGCELIHLTLLKIVSLSVFGVASYEGYSNEPLIINFLGDLLLRFTYMQQAQSYNVIAFRSF